MKKPTIARTSVTLSIVLGLAVLPVTLGHTQSRRAMTTEADYHQAMDELSNWGRWGADDQLGTLNFITPEVVKNAAKCIKTGDTFPLSVTLEESGIQVGFIPGRINPILEMISVNEPIDPQAGIESFHTSDDVVRMGLQAATHWDGLCHASYNGFIYTIGFFFYATSMYKTFT